MFVIKTLLIVNIHVQECNMRYFCTDHCKEKEIESHNVSSISIPIFIKQKEDVQQWKQ